MKYPSKELQSFLDAFSPYSEDELIIKMQKTNPECAPHIAAKILLNKKRNRKNRIIIVIAALTLLFAFLTFLLDVIHWPKEKPNIEAPKTQTELQAPKPKTQNPVLQKKPFLTIQQQSKQNKTNTK